MFFFLKFHFEGSLTPFLVRLFLIVVILTIYRLLNIWNYFLTCTWGKSYHFFPTYLLSLILKRCIMSSYLKVRVFLLPWMIVCWSLKRVVVCIGKRIIFHKIGRIFTHGTMLMEIIVFALHFIWSTKLLSYMTLWILPNW